MRALYHEPRSEPVRNLCVPLPLLLSSRYDSPTEWLSRGARHLVFGHPVFAVDVGDGGKGPRLVLHGFPSSRDVIFALPRFAEERRVVVHDPARWAEKVLAQYD